MLIWLGLVALAAVAGFLWGRATAPGGDGQGDRGEGRSLIDGKLDMRKILLEPDASLGRLRGKVRSIHVLSPNSSWPPSYASFLLDADGEGHWLEEGRMRAVVEGNARWLAKQLGVPYEGDD